MAYGLSSLLSMKVNDTPIGLGPIKFLNLWAGFINQSRIDELVALYRNGAVLMPTFSPNSVRNEMDLRYYFEGLAAKKGLQVRVHEKNLDCLQIEKNSYVVGGIYDFSFEVNGALRTFPSRFTFVIDLEQDNPILHHHSSEIPSSLS